MRLPFLFLALAVFRIKVTRAEEIRLSDLSRLELKDLKAEFADHHGARALRLTEKESAKGEGLAIIKNLVFHNGTLDVDVSGAPAKNASDQARGFIGVCFRATADAARFEMIYVRPTNGRADDQLQRNHTTQYVSAPEWPWRRLRTENPGVFESYTDMLPGEWTHLQIKVHGTDASLFVGEPGGKPLSKSAQPCLIVHGLKRGDTAGAVALWIGPETEGYFRNLSISDESK